MPPRAASRHLARLSDAVLPLVRRECGGHATMHPSDALRNPLATYPRSRQLPLRGGARALFVLDARRRDDRWRRPYRRDLVLARRIVALASGGGDAGRRRAGRARVEMASLAERNNERRSRRLVQRRRAARDRGLAHLRSSSPSYQPGRISSVRRSRCTSTLATISPWFANASWLRSTAARS